jgi:hypothetical protein
LNRAIAKQEETARDIAKLKGSLEATMADARMDPETKERLDGEHGGRTLAKATKKRKQWDAAEVSSGDDGEGAEDAGPRRSTKVKAEEKNVEEKEDEAEEKAEETKEEKPLDKKEKAK